MEDGGWGWGLVEIEQSLCHNARHVENLSAVLKLVYTRLVSLDKVEIQLQRMLSILTSFKVLHASESLSI